MQGHFTKLQGGNQGGALVGSRSDNAAAGSLILQLSTYTASHFQRRALWLCRGALKVPADCRLHEHLHLRWSSGAFSPCPADGAQRLEERRFGRNDDGPGAVRHILQSSQISLTTRNKQAQTAESHSRHVSTTHHARTLSTYLEDKALREIRASPSSNSAGVASHQKHWCEGATSGKRSTCSEVR